MRLVGMLPRARWANSTKTASLEALGVSQQDHVACHLCRRAGLGNIHAAARSSHESRIAEMAGCHRATGD